MGKELKSSCDGGRERTPRNTRANRGTLAGAGGPGGCETVEKHSAVYWAGSLGPASTHAPRGNFSRSRRGPVLLLVAYICLFCCAPEFGFGTVTISD